MAITNHERVGKALELLKSGLGPFVEREFKSTYRSAPGRGGRFWARTACSAKKPVAEWDVAALLKVMWESWNDVFRKTLGPGRAQPGQRAARPPQQVGAPGDVLQRRRLPRARLGRRGC